MEKFYFNDYFRIGFHQNLINGFREYYLLEKSNFKSKYSIENWVLPNIEKIDETGLENKFEFLNKNLCENPIQIEIPYGLNEVMYYNEPVRLFDPINPGKYTPVPDNVAAENFLLKIKLYLSIVGERKFALSEVQDLSTQKQGKEKKITSYNSVVYSSVSGKFDIKINYIISVIQEAIRNHFCLPTDEIESFNNEWVVVKRNLGKSLNVYFVFYLRTHKSLMEKGYFQMPKLPRIYISSAQNFSFNWLFSKEFSSEFLALGILDNPFSRINIQRIDSMQVVLCNNQILTVLKLNTFPYPDFFQKSLIISDEKTTYKNNLLLLENVVKYINNQFYQLKVLSDDYFNFLTQSIFKAIE